MRGDKQTTSVGVALLAFLKGDFYKYTQFLMEIGTNTFKTSLYNHDRPAAMARPGDFCHRTRKELRRKRRASEQARDRPTVRYVFSGCFDRWRRSRALPDMRLSPSLMFGTCGKLR